MLDRTMALRVERLLAALDQLDVAGVELPELTDAAPPSRGRSLAGSSHQPRAARNRRPMPCRQDPRPRVDRAHRHAACPGGWLGPGPARRRRSGSCPPSRAASGRSRPGPSRRPPPPPSRGSVRWCLRGTFAPPDRRPPQARMGPRHAGDRSPPSGVASSPAMVTTRPAPRPGTGRRNRARSARA